MGLWVKHVATGGQMDPTFPETHAAVVPRGGQQGAGYVPANSPHLRVVVIELGHDLHLELRGPGGRGDLLPAESAGQALKSRITGGGADSAAGNRASPQGDQLKDAHVLGGDGQHVEGAPQVRGEGDVVHGVRHGHQCLRLRVLPVQPRGHLNQQTRLNTRRVRDAWGGERGTDRVFSLYS